MLALKTSLQNKQLKNRARHAPTRYDSASKNFSPAKGKKKWTFLPRTTFNQTIKRLLNAGRISPQACAYLRLRRRRCQSQRPEAGEDGGHNGRHRSIVPPAFS